MEHCKHHWDGSRKSTRVVLMVNEMINMLVQEQIKKLILPRASNFYPGDFFGWDATRVEDVVSGRRNPNPNLIIRPRPA